MRTLARLTLGVTAVLLLVAPAQAQQSQDAPQTLVISQWKCDMQQIGSLMAEVDSVARPVWQAMVDEGHLYGVGTYTHEWGDEWNVNFYYVASDKAAFFSAWDEINRRISERLPEDAQNPFVERCKEHRDNIYRFGPSVEGS